MLILDGIYKDRWDVEMASNFEIDNIQYDENQWEPHIEVYDDIEYFIKAYRYNKLEQKLTRPSE